MTESTNPGEPLALAAALLATTGRQAVGWISDPENAAKVGSDRARAERDTRRMIMQADRLSEAARRPMAVAVFGPSQVGKSHLISVLARKGDALFARFDGMPEPVNYIEVINPDKGKEATGLVSRFTLKPVKAPPGYPVSLRLLSHSDIIKILANAYFYEGNPARYETWPTPEEIDAHVSAFLGAAGAEGAAGLTVDDIWDIADYFQRYMPESELTKRLDDFWEDAAEIAPKLPIERLGKLFSILWGGHDALTELYQTLVGGLAKLGFAAEAFVPFEAIDATQRGVQSILDVEALSHLGQSDAPMLAIATSTGASAQLPRAVVTALTAELRIVLTEKPWDFFDHTDLLDFPGYRGRGLDATDEDHEDLSGLAYHLAKNPAKTIQEMILRGKVEYLFQRYVAEQEITSMLLCVKESNMDVKKLPDVVANWVATTHGAKPKARVGKQPLLFFIFTRFDVHFEERGSDKTMGLDQRFDGRMKASLIEAFGKGLDSWPQQWTPDRPFTNSFLMRNPNIKNKAIFSFDEAQREIALLKDSEEQVAQLRQAFVSVPAVNRHFVDPAKAFDEMMRLNDGGASHIAQNLALVCKPTMKAEQVRDRLADIRDRMSKTLRRYYVDTDVEKRLAERLAAAERILDDLERCEQARRFGTFLRGFMVDCQQMGDRFHHALTWRDRARGSVSAQPEAASAPAAVASRPRRPGQPVQMPQAAANGAVLRAPVTRSRERVLAETAIKAWGDGMRSNANNAAFCSETGVSVPSIIEIADELSGAARRLRLEDELEAKLRAFSHEERRDELTARAVIVAESCLNRFVSSLGFADKPLESRPPIQQSDGSLRRAFEPRPTQFDAESIPEEAVPFRDRYYEDWTFAFYELVKSNAASEDGQAINVAQNGRMGKILSSIESFA